MKSYLTYLLVTILTSLVSSQLNTQTCDNLEHVHHINALMLQYVKL